MSAYDSLRFNPPAPLALVTLRDPDTGNMTDVVPMLIDTGADVTLLPKSAVSKLGLVAQTDERYEVEGFDGTASLVPVARLEMIFVGKSFRGRFLLTDGDWGILGRNVLNAVRITLDGPRLEWN